MKFKVKSGMELPVKQIRTHKKLSQIGWASFVHWMWGSPYWQ